MSSNKLFKCPLEIIGGDRRLVNQGFRFKPGKNSRPAFHPMSIGNDRIRAYAVSAHSGHFAAPQFASLDPYDGEFLV